MQARHTLEDGVQILCVEGDIDLAVSPDLRDILRGLAKDKPATLAVDLSKVPYIDSSGLATLIDYVRLAQEFQGKLAIVGATARVKTIFEIVRLDQFMPMHDSIEEARASWNLPPRET